MRCFIALSFDDKVNTFCQEKISELKRAGFRAKWVERENLHLTLFFMGEIEQNEISMLKRIIKEQNTKSFYIDFDRIGYFKHSDTPSVIWLGLKENQELKTLYEDLCIEIKKRTGMTFGDGYRPHLTLGRVKYAPENWRDVLQKQHHIKLRPFIEKVHLYSSTLIKKGPIYEQLI